MPKILTNTQIEQYHETGFVPCVDVMSEHEAEHYHQRLQEAEANYPEQVNPVKRNNAHLVICCLDELAHHPVILGAVEDLIGADFSLWASVLFIKEAMSPHYVSWHQDATYMGMNGHDFVTPWLALTHSNRETGCMSMIPGSHKNHIQQHRDTYEQDNILTRGQNIEGTDERKAVDLILKPGQMSLHHGEIIHGSQANKSAERRVGFALQSFMPPTISQTIGENYWLDVQGDNSARKGSIRLERPKRNADPANVAMRNKVDENLANILYHGAKQRRAY